MNVLTKNNRSGWWDILAILLYFPATFIMTYPLIMHLDGQWLAYYDPDAFIKIWDIWWLRHLLTQGGSWVQTSYLFYPHGLDMSIHSISWVVAGGGLLLMTVFNIITVFNLTVLLAILTTGWGAYYLAREWHLSRPAAWLAGAVYTFVPTHIAHAGGHPDLTFLLPIPLAVLFMKRALEQKSYRHAVYLALTIGLAAFTSLYILDFLFFTLAPLFVFWTFTDGRWRNGRFLKVVAVTSILSLLILLLRLWPILSHLEVLTEAMDMKFFAAQTQTDLRAFVTPSRLHTIFAPLVEDVASQFAFNKRWPAYLGIVALLLMVTAVTWRKKWRVVWPWFITGILFFLLAIGPVLRVNGQVYDTVNLPYSYLEWFPPVRTVGRPDFFVMGLILPLAICAAFGLERLLIRLQNHSGWRIALVVGAVSLLLFEYWNGPFRGSVPAVSAFYDTLAANDEQTAVIDLPLGRQPSKRYMYYQTIHGKPIAEGLSARTPAEAYVYIDNNLLLRQWRQEVPLNCETVSAQSIQQAIQVLIQDGFRYVMVHHEIEGEFPSYFVDYFPISPFFADEQITVFALEDLQAASICP
ncbi:MAG: hypothetical protein KC415_22770 [Anaerolineales bacterium]|nr:hypothetical protein [Anaerolineales bacterium]